MMLQQILVGLIVLAATWVVLRKYLPKPLRRHTAAVSAAALRGAGAVRLAQWLETDLPAASSCADGCGSCGNCAAPAPISTSATDTTSKPTETPIGSSSVVGTLARPSASGNNDMTGLGKRPASQSFSISPDALRGTIRRQ